MSETESFVVTSARRLFGLNRPNPHVDPAADDRSGHRPSLAAQARHHLLGAIGEFIIAHDLHLNGRRLMLVHDLLARRDSWLGERHAERKRSGLAINDQWLEQIDCEHGQQNRSQLDQLMAEFECQVGQFATSTRDTRLAAEGYESKLTDAVTGSSGHVASPEGLARLAQQMIDQTRDLVQTMKTSEQHSQGLQRRLEQAKLASETDTLTGLPNRRAFEEHFGRQIQLARKGNYSLCVAFCDIDNFKCVNDQHGHDAGDRVLRKVGSELASLVSTRSFVSRHGGEEFVILFAQMNLTAAKARLDEIRTRLGSTELCNRANGENIGFVTFSAGIVDVMGYPNPRDALSAADKAMYLAKRAGKNQVLCG
jgi:diguanylate cyclase